MKFKHYLAAILASTTLVCATANAAIIPGNPGGSSNGFDGSAFSGAGGSELLLYGFDGTNTYVRDLGITFNEMASGSPSFSVAADSNMTGFIGGLQSWAVIAADDVRTTNFSGTDTFGYRFMGTTPNGAAIAPDGNNEISGTTSKISTSITTLNGLAGIGDDGSAVFSGGTGAFDFLFAGGGIDVSGALTGVVGDVIDFVLYSETATAQSFGSFTLFTPTGIAATLLGTFGLDSAGTLTFNSASTVIPVPAAVWLFGSALLGLVGVSRRKNALAV